MILCIFEYVHVILASNKYEKHEKVYQFLHIFTKIKEKYYQNVHEFEEKKKQLLENSSFNPSQHDFYNWSYISTHGMAQLSMTWRICFLAQYSNNDE